MKNASSCPWHRLFVIASLLPCLAIGAGHFEITCKKLRKLRVSGTKKAKAAKRYTAESAEAAQGKAQLAVLRKATRLSDSGFHNPELVLEALSVIAKKLPKELKTRHFMNKQKSGPIEALLLKHFGVRKRAGNLYHAAMAYFGSFPEAIKATEVPIPKPPPFLPRIRGSEDFTPSTLSQGEIEHALGLSDSIIKSSDKKFLSQFHDSDDRSQHDALVTAMNYLRWSAQQGLCADQGKCFYQADQIERALVKIHLPMVAMFSRRFEVKRRKEMGLDNNLDPHSLARFEAIGEGELQYLIRTYDLSKASFGHYAHTYLPLMMSKKIRRIKDRLRQLVSSPVEGGDPWANKGQDSSEEEDSTQFFRQYQDVAVGILNQLESAVPEGDPFYLVRLEMLRRALGLPPKELSELDAPDPKALSHIEPQSLSQLARILHVSREATRVRLNKALALFSDALNSWNFDSEVEADSE